ncbi:hypothetical protein C8039_14505 [Halogeometricum sp. wsp3]|nr:hypothetical protein C8039_14505 [Halogeometricum sp. wsp3]
MSSISERVIGMRVAFRTVAAARRVDADWRRFLAVVGSVVSLSVRPKLPAQPASAAVAAASLSHEE